MKTEELFKQRLKNILGQLSSDQQEELLEHLLTQERFQPEGYPYNYKGKTFEELNDEEIKFLHDKFIEIQWSDNPTLQNEDIRSITIYPYNT